MKKLIFIFLLFCSILQAQTTYYIKTYSDGGRDEAGRNGLVGQEWATLSYAIGRVTTINDTIYVNSGTYPAISIQMLLSDGVTIKGAGKTIVTIPLTYPTTNSPCIKLETSNGWESDASGNQHISGITFDGYLTASVAIAVNYRSNVLIHDCEFIDFIDGAVRYTGEPYVNFTTDNPYVEAGFDFNLIPFSDSFCTGNKFYNNIVTNCARYVTADHHTGGLSIGTQDGIQIYGNTMDNSLRGGYGIKFWEAGFNKNLDINNNDITAHVWTDAWRYEFAIEIWWSMGGDKIYNNRLRGALDIVHCVDLYSVGSGMRVYDNNIGRDAIPMTGERAILLEGKIEYIDIYRNYIHHVATPFYIPRQTNGGYTGSDRLFHVKFYINLCVHLGRNDTGWQTWGIYFNPQDAVMHQAETEYFYVQHNTFVVDAGITQITWYGLMLPCVDDMSYIYYDNNIVQGYDYAGVVAAYTRTKADHIYVRNNLLYDNGGNNDPVFDANFTASLTNYTYSDIVPANPSFVSSTDYHLSSTSSPAYHTGYDVDIETDYENNAFNAITPSIGAYEINESKGEGGVGQFNSHLKHKVRYNNSFVKY